MGADNIRIHLNPQDFELAKALRERHEEQWKLLEDEALLPGGCRIETLHSRIDATMETRIEKAVAQLFDQLHDQALHPAAPDIAVELDGNDAP
ncbi:flagellar assembly protein H [compost metagenome]